MADEAPTEDPAPDADPADTTQPAAEVTDPEPTEHIAPAADPAAEPSPTPTPEDTEDPVLGTDPIRNRARRIYVAPDPAGLPGAADIYVRATG